MTPYRIVKTSHVQGDQYVMKDGKYLGRLVPVELDYEAAEIAYSNHETSKTIVDVAVGEETDDETT